MILLLWKLFLAFLEIGALGFGGGYAMLSLIYDRSATFGMTLEQFADLNAIDMLIPGPIAINSATYVGYLFGNFPGALVATIGVILPTIAFVILYLKYEDKILNNPYLSRALDFAKLASCGLITAVALTLAINSVFDVESLEQIIDFSNQFAFFPFLVIIVSGYLHFKHDINPILLTLGSGVVGYIFSFKSKNSGLTSRVF